VVRPVVITSVEINIGYDQSGVDQRHRVT